MKNLLFFFAFAFCCSSFVLPGPEQLGKVNREEGFYLFVDNRPVEDYEILGYVEKTTTWLGDYEEVKAALIRRAAKQYPEAEGLIFDFSIFGPNKAAAISFTGGETDKQLGKVLTYNGIHLFVDSRPVRPYRTLGKVKKHWAWTREYEEMRNGLVKKAVRKFPEADAVVLNLPLGRAHEAEVIAFE